MAKKMLIVDGNSLIFRTYFATAYRGTMMQTPDGTPTNAVYGFVNIIQKLINSHEYDYIFVAFDAKGPSWRKEEYQAYKAKRAKTPPELLSQFPIVKSYLDSNGVKWYEQVGLEADDIVGTLAVQASYDHVKVDILSSDRDLYQLINNDVNVLFNNKGMSQLVRVDESALAKKFQITPKQIIDYKALMGDSSDNLPGIKNIGPKTASQLLTKYQSFGNIYNHLSELTPKVATTLKEHKAEGEMSLKLATLVTDAKLPFNYKDCTYQSNWEELANFFRKYSMHSFLNRLIPSQQLTFNFDDNQKIQSKTHEVKLVLTWDKKYQAELNSVILLLTEPNYHRADILAMAIYNSKGSFVILGKNLKQDEQFKAFLASEKYQKICLNYKQLYCACVWHHLNVGGVIFDVHLASYVYNSNIKPLLANILKLFELEQNWLTDKEFFHQHPINNFASTEKGKIINFIAKKAQFTYELVPIIKKALIKDNEWKLFEEMELPLANVLGKCEMAGVKVDPQQLKTQIKAASSQVEALKRQIQSYSKLGAELNPNSPKQLLTFLFEELQLPAPKKPNTSEGTLEKLIVAHPVIKIILAYRKYQKLYSTYLEGFQKWIFPDGKVHTIFRQTETSTGRLSSTAPNLQNIAIRDEMQRSVRKIFVPSEPNATLVSFDYSQIELRVLAHMANSPHLIEAFNRDEDIHTHTASKIFKIPIDKVTSQERRLAKVVNFGIIYGISAYGLAQRLHLKQAYAKNFIDEYFAQFPAVKTYMDQSIKTCQEQHYVETLFHRRRYLPEIVSNNPLARQAGKRAAMNMPIQGTAADIIKIAMVNIQRELDQSSLSAKMICQIHDELIFEVKSSNLSALTKLVIDKMTHAVKLKVPLKVDVNSGKSWYDLK